jgi:hypothetical protein
VIARRGLRAVEARSPRRPTFHADSMRAPARFPYRKENTMLLVLAILILILALGGGIFISKFLFLLLLIALIVALFSRRTV